MQPAEPRWMVCRRCGEERPASPGAACPADGVPLVAREAWAEFPDDAVLGTVVSGRYAVIDVVGAGGYGTVYRAWQSTLSRPVALKLIRPDRAHSDEIRRRFFLEARLVAQLTDPAVVTLFDFGEEPDGTLFMAFELIEGRTLASALKQGPMRPVRVAQLLLPLLGALAEAHQKGVVHRDLKPDNVMLSAGPHGGERVRLLDFGIAKDLRADDGVRTLTGMVMGTPQYMAPEQCRGEPVDPRTDLYAVGVLAFAMLTAELPFAGANAAQVVTAQMTKPPRPFPPALQLPKALCDLVLRALARDPAQRFQSANQMAMALRFALPELSASGPPVAVAPPPAPRSLVATPRAGVSALAVDTTTQENLAHNDDAPTAPMPPLRFHDTD